jgi:hypothetical protein
MIKAIWAINREGKWFITMSNTQFLIMKTEGKGLSLEAGFDYKYHNNSEIEAMKAALLYIYEQEKK